MELKAQCAEEDDDSSAYKLQRLSNKNDNNRIFLRIISATYGPSTGRRLLNGELSNDVAKVPYSRDVLPFLKTIAHLRTRTDSLQSALYFKEYNGKSIDQEQVRSIEIEPTRASIVLINEGKTMNLLFGDPCPGTTKCLNITYIFEKRSNLSKSKSLSSQELWDSTNDGDDDNDDVFQDNILQRVSFAEHQQVVLERQTKRKRSLSMSHISYNSLVAPTTISGSSPGSSPWRLPIAVSELVVPLFLPYLSIRQRVACEQVCKTWKKAIKNRGVAGCIDVVSDPAFANFEYLKGVIEHSFCSLHTLVLNDCRDLSPSYLNGAIPNLHQLRNLDISRCSKIGDDTLLLVANLVSLELLYIKGLSRVTDNGVVAIAESCTCLQVLEISNILITDVGGKSIGNNLVNLKALYMRDNFKLTNESVDLITSNCTKLSQLTLWGSTRLHHFQFDSLENLVLLNLWGCHSLTDDAIKTLTTMRHLRTLILSECHKISDVFVRDIPRIAPNICNLHLRYCRNISDESLYSLSNLESIYSLDLSYCNKITSTAVFDLICSCPYLSELRLFFCFQLDLDSILSFLTQFKKTYNRLSVLDVRDCFESDDDINFSLLSTTYAEAGFQEKVPLFFTRSAQWSTSKQHHFETQLLMEPTSASGIKESKSFVGYSPKSSLGFSYQK